MEELWFTSPSGASQQGRADMLGSIPVILGVCESFKDKQSQLEELLNSMVSGKDGKEKSSQSALKSRFSDLCDALIDSLLDASEIPNFVRFPIERRVHLLITRKLRHPSIVSVLCTTSFPFSLRPCPAQRRQYYCHF